MTESKNPQVVLNAIIAAPEKIGDVVVNDITILRYAYLEKLHSPFIDASKDFTVESIVPSVYVLALDKKELRKYSNDIEALKLDALDWADEKLKIEDMSKIIEVVVSKFTAMNKAAPTAVEVSDPKKN